MKKFKVLIDFESHEMEVEANNKEEADTKAYNMYAVEVDMNKHPIPPFWVGDVEEVE